MRLNRTRGTILLEYRGISWEKPVKVKKWAYGEEPWGPSSSETALFFGKRAKLQVFPDAGTEGSRYVFSHHNKSSLRR